jgi:probable phosphoglycerate mutase
VKRLLLVRHGRTEWNRLGRIQGQTDVALDAEGQAQAAALAPVIAGFDPVAIWSSDLERAAATANRIGAEVGHLPRFDARLRERSFGDLEGISHAEFREQAPRDYDAFRAGDFDQIASAEPSDVVASRMGQATDELLSRMGEGEAAVVVSHGAALKLLVGSLLGLSPTASVATLVGMANCAWTEIHLEEPGLPGRLVAYNRTVGTQG